MEKLQSAIEQARKERYGDNGPRDGAHAAPRHRGGRGDWLDIPALEFNERHLRKKRVVAFKSSPEATPFDVLRTKILQTMRQNEWRRIIITSPTPECGKSTLAANLAFGIARQKEKHAVLMEFDLRRPGLSDILGQKPSHDIRAMLTQEVPFQEQALRIGDKVAVSLASRKSTDPTQYLNGNKTMQTLAQIESDYKPDLMIFDTPPLLVNDDTRSFLSHVDCAILVARAEATTSKQIDICEREIAEHTNVLGVVLNQCRFDDDSQGYGYEGY